MPNLPRFLTWSGAIAVLITGAGLPLPARALPFDPLPSSFERWLNAQRQWPEQQQLRFSQVGQCRDQTTGHSPYRMPVYTCLKGQLRISGKGKATQVCSLQRVSYFPGIKRVRYWTAQCRPSA